MLNKTINQLSTNIDFMEFIKLNFMKEIESKNFPENYKLKEMPKEAIDSLAEKNPAEAKNILDRQLIRNNIYQKYKFDIFEKPIVVFYEDEKAKKLKPFKKHIEAHEFSKSILNEGVYSMLISIMNHEIECEVYRN